MTGFIDQILKTKFQIEKTNVFEQKGGHIGSVDYLGNMNRRTMTVIQTNTMKNTGKKKQLIKSCSFHIIVNINGLNILHSVV